MKNAFRTTSVAGRLRLVFNLMNGFTLFATLTGFTLIVGYFSLNSFNQEIRAMVGLLASTSRAALTFQDEESGARVLSALEANQSIHFAALLDAQGKIFGSYGDRSFDQAEITQVVSRQQDWSIVRGRMVVISPVILDKDRIGTVFISAQLNNLYAQLASIMLLGLLITGIVALAATMFSWKLQGWVSGPIDSLRKLTQEISLTKDFSTRLEVRNNDEISDLIRAFNFMLDSIAERDLSLVQAKEKAENADQVKSTFLANMSHELRTPLHAIISITEEVLEKPMNAEHNDLMHTIQNAGNSLLSIINDILDFSKIEAGKMRLVPSEFNLRFVIEKTVRMFFVPAGQKNIKISVNFDSTTPNMVFADAGRISQVIVNLIGNALKFSHPGGKIELNVALDKIDSQKIRIDVADNGIGIADDKLDSIFEAFSQVLDKNLSRQGTGLGLSITSRLVKLMGGTIVVKSVLNQGSTFSFTFEYGEVVDSSHVKIDKSTSSDVLVNAEANTNISILIVEDNQVNQRVAERLMRKRGYAVFITENGQKCLDLLEKQKIDLILMDINMPVMDGIEATKRIRIKEFSQGLAHIPIIAVTASVSPDDVKLCYDAGMDEFIMKPFKSADLYSKIDRLLEKTLEPARQNPNSIN